MNTTRHSILHSSVELVKEAGGLNIKEMKSVGIIFADLTTEQVHIMREKGFIVDTIDQISTTRTVTPGDISVPNPITGVATYTPQDLLRLLGVDSARNITTPPLYGDGINIAVIGTGIRQSHQMLATVNFVYSKNYTHGVMADVYDHDTGVASLIAVIAPNCNMLNLKVLDSSGNGSEETVVEAIDDCITFSTNGENYAPGVINLSLGGPDDGDINDILRVACRAAVNAGIIVVAAAGNDGPDAQTITIPACEQYVLAVGSISPIASMNTFEVNSFSSAGPTLDGLTKPDAVMYGSNIVMASSASDSATVAKSGTSFSCPLAAGIAVIYLNGVDVQANYTNPVNGVTLPTGVIYFVPVKEIVDNFLPRICIKPTGVAAGKDNYYGYGLPYGPLIQKAFVSSAIGLDMSSVVGMMMAVMMMGMVMKMTAAPTKKKPPEKSKYISA